MRQDRPNLQTILASNEYRTPAERDGCHNCRHGRPMKSSMMRCTAQRPSPVTSKMGICGKHLSA